MICWRGNATGRRVGIGVGGALAAVVPGLDAAVGFGVGRARVVGRRGGERGGVGAYVRDERGFGVGSGTDRGPPGVPVPAATTVSVGGRAQRGGGGALGGHAGEGEGVG